MKLKEPSYELQYNGTRCEIEMQLHAIHEVIQL